MVSGRLRTLRGDLTLSRAHQVLAYCRQHWIKIALWLLVILPVAPFVIGTLLLVIYMLWPIDYDQLPPQLNVKSGKPVVIIAHGLHSSPEQWSNALKQSIEQQQPQHQVFALDWRPYSTNTFRCSIDGKRIGRLLASHLIDKQIDSVDLIAHSCGSFVILGLCEELRAQDQQITINSTYLDPVSVYGGLWWNYGVSHFGQCADFSEAYIDTRDQVPGSNQALEHAYTFDVSSLSERAGYTGSAHQWPIYYYQQSIDNNKQISPLHRQTIAKKFSKNNLYRKID